MEDRGMQLEGVYTPVVTPFDERGEIDFETLTRVIEFREGGLQVNACAADSRRV